MKFINTLKEGDSINGVYLCRHLQNAVTKNGKPYQNVTLQDKTGTLEAKIWDLSSPGISEFNEHDYVCVSGEVNSYMSSLQMKISRVRKAEEGEYIEADYLPCSERNAEEMYQELLKLIASVKTSYMHTLLSEFFEKDPEFKKMFCFHSAAKSVHHGFVGGLLEHTLSVAKICDFYASNYLFLDRDLLLTAAICHDIGKTKEIAPYPLNDYTDDGQLLGHIIIGTEMVRDKIKTIQDFPEIKERELEHCILAHHGELEYGSPKKPALAEAIALSFADNVDAKMETMKEALNRAEDNDLSWQGFNRFLDSNIRKTSKD